MEKDWTGNKKCTICGLSKPIKEFYWHKTTNNYFSECKECTKKCVKKYREQNPEKIKQMRKNYREKRKLIRYETDRKYYLKNKYKITEQQYFEMYKKLEGKCEICRKFIEYRKLNIDHSHKNNKVRGLLCKNCNFALGFFKDNIQNLKNAIKYLEKYEL